MNLLEKKLKPLKSASQAVLFNWDGIVLQSDDSIVKLSTSVNVFRDTQLFVGMKDAIVSMKDGEEIKFDCINVSFFGYEGHFDFIIERVGEGADTKYCWLIYDHSKQYQRLLMEMDERQCPTP